MGQTKVSSPSQTPPLLLHSQSRNRTRRHNFLNPKFKFRRMTSTRPDSNPVPDQNTRFQELKQFDDSKTGVKGLVDRGVTTIPSIFIFPNQADPTVSVTGHGLKPKIPVIDFSSPRSTLVDHLRQASSELGFFQIINHSVPLASIKKALVSMNEFYEQPEEVKMQYYSRDMSHGAAYSTNFDLYRSKSASWRDTIQISLGPNPPDWNYVPEACREAVKEWDEQVLKISEEIMNLLCEGLGLGMEGSSCDRLKELSCLESRLLVGHYYPYCPQPDLTMGVAGHADPTVLTVLVQNEVAGLQVKVGEEWVQVDPMEGALVVNIGDLLQMMSNGKYKSVEHRVVANPLPEARLSIAVFLNPSVRDKLYGPFPEIISPEEPARYREFTLTDYMRRFFSKELEGKTLTDYYRI